MNPRYQHTEDIDNYLNGRMSEEEKKTFEQRLDSDPDFSLEVEAQRIANQMIIGSELMELKEQMRKDLRNKPSGFKYTRFFLPLLITLLGLGAYVYLGSGETITDSSGGAPIKTMQYHDLKTILEDLETRGSINSVNGPVEESPHLLVEVKKHTVDSITSISKSKNQPVDTIAKATIEEVTNIAEPSNNSDIDTTGHQKMEDTLSTEGSPKESVSQEEVDLCASIDISGRVEVKETCSGENSGEIEIVSTSLTGGKSPYHFSLNDTSAFKDYGNFAYLHAGNYSIYVKDANGCVSLLAEDIEVSEKDCRNNLDLTFAPSREYSIKVPVKDNASATFKVFSKTGALVYQSRVGNGGVDEWDGNDLSGRAVSSGYYIFILEYMDGKTEQGSITIMR
ncbi:gliding motility-associated C-terminal domain-containing protein [Cytophagaceae bacterium ABcell3]|nr:gliding motility-associated C-terminal domain-containing protein [Cytophagaceae bacterium ABcell3]